MTWLCRSPKPTLADGKSWTKSKFASIRKPSAESPIPLWFQVMQQHGGWSRRAFASPTSLRQEVASLVRQVWKRRSKGMPAKSTMQRAREDVREGKSPTTAAGEFVHEEIEHVRRGKHGARSPQQAIAIGLSQARRAGV